MTTGEIGVSGGPDTYDFCVQGTKEKHPLNCLTIVTLAVSIRNAFQSPCFTMAANLSCLAESAFGPTRRHPKFLRTADPIVRSAAYAFVRGHMPHGVNPAATLMLCLFESTPVIQ